ncbi:MAG: ABC transporter permease subunit [Candidatus Nanopelagicales bacterium]
MHIAIVLESLRSHWRSVSAWCIGMLAISAMLLAMYPSVQDSAADMDQFIAQFPDALRAMFRMTDYSSGPGYLSTEMFSAMAPLMFIAIATAWGSSATAGEEDKGTADLLFSLPISRTSVVLSKAAAMLAVLAVVGAVLFAGIYAGTAFVSIELQLSNLLAVCVATAMLGAVFGAVALFLGALFGRRSLALGISVALAIASYLLFSLAPLVGWLGNLLPYNPFEWATGSQPLFNGWDGPGIAWLALTVMGLLGGAVVAIRRRDFGS